ncbi:MAG: hypothetical protein AMXMBFR34_01470 [Myxococcaceae bacterium]
MTGWRARGLLAASVVCALAAPALAQDGTRAAPMGPFVVAPGPDAPAVKPAPAPALTPSLAPAEAVDTTVMRARMTRYFAGEQRTGWVASGLGLASVGTGIGLIATGGEARLGVAVALVVMGALQLATGLALSIRTPKQVARLDAQLTDSPAQYAAEEGARLGKVNSRWWIYRAAEVTTAFSGVLVAGIGGVSHSDAVLGVGLTLVGEALVMLLIDHFAEARAREYADALTGFHF